MQKIVGLLMLVGILIGTLVGCGVTPEPTAPPPTQTPWIIVVTATPGPGDVAHVQPSQTPRIVVATPTRIPPCATELRMPATVRSHAPGWPRKPSWISGDALSKLTSRKLAPESTRRATFSGVRSVPFVAIWMWSPSSPACSRTGQKALRDPHPAESVFIRALSLLVSTILKLGSTSVSPH